MQTEKRPNSEVFIDLFTEIEQKLKEVCGDTYHTSFSELINRARNLSPVAQRYSSDLREYAQLRNAITHNRRENFIIAEPHLDVVNEIRHIRDLLYNPPRISKVIREKPFFVTPKTTLKEMLETLASKGYMRCPIIDNGKVICLITAKTLAKWIINKPSNFDNATLADLIPFADTGDYVIASENTDIISIIGQFKNSIKKGNYLQAILITSNGQPNSPLIGIITPSDLPSLMELVE